MPPPNPAELNLDLDDQDPTPPTTNPTDPPRDENSDDEDDSDDAEEAAMALAMGFSSFGAQQTTAGRKRKYTSGGDAFVDTASGSTDTDGNRNQSARGAAAKAGSGANMVLLGERGVRGSGAGGGGGAKEIARDGREEVVGGRAMGTGGLGGMMETRGVGDGGSSGHGLAAYRRGVVNERGDTAYFLPSFLEDPWAELGRKVG